MADERHDKPMKFYVDFENVHGAGLKGVDELDERDEVLIFYSQAAETFHIEQAIDILKSKARVSFVEVDGGTRNAADFQLIVALVGAMDDAFDYAIVTGDGGFDAAIKMAERMGLPSVRRVSNVRGEVLEVEKPKNRRSRRRGSSSASAEEPGEKAERADKPDKPDRAPKHEKGEKAAKFDKASKHDKAEKTANAGKPSNGESPHTFITATKDVIANASVEPKHRSDLLDEEAPSASASDEAVSSSPTPEESARPDNAHEALAHEDSARGGSSHAPSEEGKRSRSRRRRGPRKIDFVQNADDAQAEPVGAGTVVSPADNPNHEESPSQELPAKKPRHDEEPGRLESAQSAEASAPAKDKDAIAGLLMSKGVKLDDEQLDVVAKALDGAKDRQDFYRRIIRLLKKERGLPLYHQVREYYAEMR